MLSIFFFRSSFVDYFLLMTYNLWGMWSSKLGHHTGLYVRPQDVDDVELGRYAVVRHRLSVNDSREQKEFFL